MQGSWQGAGSFDSKGGQNGKGLMLQMQVVCKSVTLRPAFELELALCHAGLIQLLRSPMILSPLPAS